MNAVVIIGGLITTSGIIGLIYNLFRNHIVEFFREQLNNPAIELISHEKKEYGEIYYLKMPLGIKDFDTDKYSKILSNNLCQSVVIEKLQDKIKCVVYWFGYSYDNMAYMEQGIQKCLAAVTFFAQQEFTKNIRIYDKKEYNNGYILYIPHVPGLSIHDYKKASGQLKDFFDSEIEITYSDKCVCLDVYTNKLDEKYPYEFVKTYKPTELLIGMTPRGVKTIDLTEAHNVLIGGTIGMGKSTWERSAIVNMILNANDDIWLNLHDSKVVEYGIFKDCKLVNKFTTNSDDFYKLLLKIKDEVTRRYDMFKKEQVLDITQWNAENSGNKIKYIVNFVAEIAQISGHKKAMDTMRQLLEISRAAGIYFIVSTQRPSKELLPPEIKAQLDTRISFRVADSINAWIILDRDNTSEHIKLPGRGILKVGGDMKEFHSYMLTAKEAIEKVKHTFR